MNQKPAETSSLNSDQRSFCCTQISVFPEPARYLAFVQYSKLPAFITQVFLLSMGPAGGRCLINKWLQLHPEHRRWQTPDRHQKAFVRIDWAILFLNRYCKPTEVESSRFERDGPTTATGYTLTISMPEPDDSRIRVFIYIKPHDIFDGF